MSAADRAGARALAALEVFDVGVVVCRGHATREPYLYANPAARALLHDLGAAAGCLPELLADAATQFIAARGSPQPSRPLRLEAGERVFYVRVIASVADGEPVEVVLLRVEGLRDADLFRELTGRYGVTRREYQVLRGLRLGQRNREIATELDLSEGTVKSHVQRLLERFDVANRTALVQLVERLVSRRQ